MARDYDVLIDLRDHARNILLDSGISRDVAEAVASQLQERFRKHWGGQNVYFTKSKDLSARDLEIFNKWTGRNKEQLIREYGLSEQWLYRIVERGRAKIMEERQVSLFSPSES